MIIKKPLPLAVIISSLLGCSGLASAASLVGTGDFNLSGSVYVAETAFLFGYSRVPTSTSSDQSAGILVPATGAWQGLSAGQIAGMKNLLTPTNGGAFGPGPVVPGTNFLVSRFLTLPNGIDVDLTGLPVNTAVPVCGTPGEDAPGYVCRVQPGSPVILEQGATGVTALLNLVGRAYYAGTTNYSPLLGTFSANFSNAPDLTISGLLDDFYTKGFLATGFSANFSVGAPLSTPEPTWTTMLGMSFLGLFAALARRRRAASFQ